MAVLAKARAASCLEDGKVKPTLRIQTIMKIWARTFLFFFFDDIRDPNPMCNILLSAFDENMVYATSKAEYVPRAEYIGAVNYLNHKVVEDRYASRSSTSTLSRTRARALRICRLLVWRPAPTCPRRPNPGSTLSGRWGISSGAPSWCSWCRWCTWRATKQRT